MKSSAQINTILDTLKQLVPGMAKAIGPGCEVILHDVRTPDSSCIAISGDVTGRKIGAPMTDLGLRILREEHSTPHLINYLTTTADGRPTRSSTFIIRDSQGDPAAMFCINFDLSPLLDLQQLGDRVFPKNPVVEGKVIQDDTQETFYSDVGDVLTSTVSAVLHKFGKPVSIMDKQDKLKIVKLLDEAGIFAIKKAHFYVASALNTSRYTIYNYLNEVRLHYPQPESDTTNDKA